MTQEYTSEFNIIFKLASESIIINNKDVRTFHFNEDIFSFCMFGKLIFIDSDGIMENGPLTGNEKISIIYGRDSNRELTFDIIKVKRIDSIERSDTRENMIEIDFADLTFDLFTGRKFSKSWKNKKISSIVKSIIDNYILGIKIGKWENNDKQIDVCFPYITPIKSLIWLSKRGYGSRSGTSGFVYYNSTEKNFIGNWVTLDYLFSSLNSYEKDNYVFESENLYYRNKILEWSLSGIDKFSFKGIRGSNYFGFDFNKKKLLKSTEGYKDLIPEVTVMGKKSLYVDITDYKTSYDINGESDLDCMYSLLQSDFIKRYSVQQDLTIIVKGFEDRFAGNQIIIEWPSVDSIQLYNKSLKGKWLIKSIKHVFGQRGYLQKITLLKNGYLDSDQTKLLNSSKSNLGV